jgi:hypothetical protein
MGLMIEVPTSNEWHVMKAEVQYGPFTYSEMLQMLQNKTLFSFDFIWSTHLDAWSLLGDQPEFSADRIHRIFSQNAAQNTKTQAEVFSRRKFERVNCDLSVFLHDNQKLWEGQVQSLSEGGILVAVNNPFLLPGDGLTVHFRKSSSAAKGFAQAFNTRMEVLNKRLTKQKLSYDLQILYALQFTQLPEHGRNAIADFVKLNAEQNITQGE